LCLRVFVVNFLDSEFLCEAIANQEKRWTKVHLSFF